MNEHPHLLFVAWGFPPARTGGVHRALATANAFAADGWRVTVLTAPRAVFLDVTGADEALEGLVDPRVRVLRVPFGWPAQQTDLHTFGLTRVLAPRLWAKSRAWLDRRSFPEVGYGPWRSRIEAAALGVHARERVDLVLATTNPQVAVTVGLRLRREHGVPYVVDYRDAWTLHTYSGRRTLAARSAAGRWEARSLGGAVQVWLVNEPLRRWHARTHPAAAARMHVVMNGYDRDLPPPALARDPLRFGYLGTLTPIVPVRALADGWRHGREHEPALARALAEVHGHLGYYATPDAGIAAILDTAAGTGMTYRGPVSKTQVDAVYAGFDVLILALGGGEYITSGKVFEYMSTGLPIVSVLTAGNAAADVLAGYPRWHPAADLSRTAVGAALAAGALDARHPQASQRAGAAQRFARRYRRDAQLEPRITALRALVS